MRARAAYFTHGLRARALSALACGGTISKAAPPPLDKSTGALAIEVRGPGRARYDPSAVGVGGQQVVLALENRSAVPLSIEGFAMDLEATRSGVCFPCAEHVPLARREPRTIAPGARVEIVREIDCTMPALGTYSVTAFASWAGAPRHMIGSFDLVVFDEAARAPREIAPGVRATIAGPTLIEPTSRYLATVVLVNETRAPKTVGPLSITLRSRPRDAELWCTGAPRQSRRSPSRPGARTSRARRSRAS